MKLNPPGVSVMRGCSFANWFLAILCAGFLPVISASSAVDSQTGAKELTPTEQWVVARLTAGKIADLSTHGEKDRKLSANFLEDLLMGELPGFKPPRNQVAISGAIIDELIDLNSAQIPFAVVLFSCQFNEELNFDNANFTRGLSLSSSSFFKRALFHSMKVGGDADFPRARFKGPANFYGIKVEGGTNFNAALFEDRATFAWADIAGKFTAENARFGNEQMEANFGAEPDFQSMKVGGDADFNGALFEGPVDFVRADIKGGFTAFKAKFQNKKQANFASMKTGGRASFYGALFKGTAQFGEAEIASDFDALDATFQNKASFFKLKVGGRAYFIHAQFEGLVDFRFVDISWLDLSNASWPKLPDQVLMQGMNYRYISRGLEKNEPKSHEALLELAKQSPYTADVYTNLEAFFLREGYRADADKAFIQGKCRERKKYFDSGHWFGWLGSWMLYLLVGYGRRPWQAAIPCAFFVALGCVLFAPEKMEPQNPQDTPRGYNRFWYSLSLFLPFVDLQASKVWKPKVDRTCLRNYMRVHTLL